MKLELEFMTEERPRKILQYIKNTSLDISIAQNKTLLHLEGKPSHLLALTILLSGKRFPVGMIAFGPNPDASLTREWYTAAVKLLDKQGELELNHLVNSNPTPFTSLSDKGKRRYD